jgi:hypothetical protein
MIGLFRRRAAAVLRGVTFCDSCVEVTTAEDRARRRYDRTRAEFTALTVLR